MTFVMITASGGHRVCKKEIYPEVSYFFKSPTH